MMISKELKQFLDVLNQEIDDDEYEYRETGCDERTIASESARFTENTGLTLDAEYLALMAVTNGVLFNGMTIFPFRKHEHCDETIAQANDDMREHLSDEYLYYGSFDEELYCYHIPSAGYQAIEYAGMPVWEYFESANAMFMYMMNRCMP
jgi:hypothetical protein